jgi:hypothetical protein
MKAEKENGRWTKTPKGSLGKRCKRRTMHHATIKQTSKGKTKRGISSAKNIVSQVTKNQRR